jgi:hypothetical protein
MRALITVVYLALCLALTGCGPSLPEISEVETEIKDSIDEAQIQSGKAPLKSISLVDVGERHWEGYIELSDGSRANLDVKLGTDNKYIWKVD